MSQVAPVSVEDALRLFNEVQQLTVRDAQDSERFDAVAGDVNNNTPANNSNNRNNKANTNTNNRGSANNTNRSGPITTEAELRRQVELSEAVMKKLHAKNKALTQELEELQRKQQHQGGGGGSTSNVARSNSGGNGGDEVVSALRRKVAEQDATIERLRGELSKPPLAAKSNQQQQQHQQADGDTAEHIKLFEQRVAQLQQQLDQVLDSKLECIRDGESTGRVNKEVKAFFVTSRQKMIDDAAFHEAERALLNQRLAKLEAEVMSLRLRHNPQVK